MNSLHMLLLVFSLKFFVVITTYPVLNFLNQVDSSQFRGSRRTLGIDASFCCTYPSSSTIAAGSCYVFTQWENDTGTISGRISLQSFDWKHTVKEQTCQGKVTNDEWGVYTSALQRLFHNKLWETCSVCYF